MAAHQPTPAEDHAALLEEAFLALDTPEGFRAELVGGAITVTPPPDGEHEDVISWLLRQVLTRSATEMDASGNKGLRVETGGARARQHVIPDATFAPRALRLFRHAPPWMAPDGVAMVAEVSSRDARGDRGARDDRGPKRRGYARAGIPCYLLVDREKESITLFSEPERGDYAGSHTVPYGKPLTLPEPFGFELDSGELR